MSAWHDDNPANADVTSLQRALSPLGVWALSLGCSIGWGAFVMPATTLLPKAGPMGTALGMALSALIMLVIAASFHYLMNRNPDSGGAFTFTRKILGSDHAFLCAWALVLAYVSIMWANATAFVLISRYLFGGVFQFGFHYVVAGYDVYLGEILVTLVILGAFGLFSCANRRLVNTVNTALAIVLFVGVLACLAIVASATSGNPASFQPSFTTDSAPAAGVFAIVALAPWAFLGFESVSHAAGECKFSMSKMFAIMAMGVICGAVIYMAMTLVSVMGTPAGYSSWEAYIADSGSLQGLAGLPTFAALQSAMGGTGVALLAITVVAAIATTLIGLYRATSRLLLAVAQDGILPPWFAKTGTDGVPRNAILFILISIYSLQLRREKELDDQRREAEAMNRAKTVFFSNISHDIRTPMNAIIGYTQLAQRPGITLPEAQNYLQKIEASSEYLLTLINDVLEMSRIESGKMELELSETNLTKIMDDMGAMFSVQMQEKGIEYTVDAQGVRDSRVLCDSTRLNRVLLNLIGNAYKFTPEGGAVTVTLDQSDDVVNGCATYELRVKDTGIGMSPEFAQKVFQAFERERSELVDSIQGTGLGMAITKSIVDLMDGTITLQSEPGKGTEFTVRLNLKVVPEGAQAGLAPAADATRARAADSAGKGAASQLDFTGKRILLVEDNEINREIASFILENAGFTVEQAENGKVGLDLVTASAAGYYDAILMDVRMPVMNGREATRQIRALADPALSQIPIIGSAASAFADDIRDDLDAGMDAFVPKPVDANLLLSILASYVL